MKEFYRSQYLKKECSHSEYYGQFINELLIKTVVYHIGGNRIIDSSCPHFNDIPLNLWDRLVFVPDRIDREKWKRLASDTYGKVDQSKFLWALSDQVCIAKECARLWKAESLELLNKQKIGGV